MDFISFNPRYDHAVYWDDEPTTEPEDLFSFALKYLNDCKSAYTNSKIICITPGLESSLFLREGFVAMMPFDHPCADKKHKKVMVHLHN